MFESFKYFKNLYYALILIVSIVLIGTIGYMAVESYSPLDSFYMTVITVSTVGFKEVHPLSEEGKVFTAFLIIISFGTFAYAVSSLSRYLITGEIKYYYKNFKVHQEIKKLTGHVIVCGFGRNGQEAVKSLEAYNKKVVIIEKDESAMETLQNNGKLYIEGDATNEDVLLKGGLDKASALVTTLPKDSENVFVVLTAREMNHDLRIISRATASSSNRKLKIAGANNVIMPDKVGGAHMASLVVTPDIYEFLERISMTGQDDINLEELDFKNIPDDYHNDSIKELKKHFSSNCLIIGYKGSDGQFVVNPSDDTKIVPHSKLFVLGTPDQLSELKQELKI
ncbi:potassium channel family protein [Salibacter halophilus]|nr:potassium channel protein [Salibacter halophilus]